MDLRNRHRLVTTVALLMGLALLVSLVLYALRANIDLFYTPGEVLYGKTATQQPPRTGQRLRVGGMVAPGSVQRDPATLNVSFRLYDAAGEVMVHYDGILPDLFREDQGVVVQGILEPGPRILASEVLAKHDENYTQPEIVAAMESHHGNGSPRGPDIGQEAVR